MNLQTTSSATVLVLLLGANALAAGQRYERLIRHQPLERIERRALKAVRQWSREQGAVLRFDERLRRAAEMNLPDVPVTSTARLDVNNVRTAAQGW